MATTGNNNNDGAATLEALPYVFLAEYNGTGPAGGDPLTQNLNIWYNVRFCIVSLGIEGWCSRVWFTIC